MEANANSDQPNPASVPAEPRPLACRRTARWLALALAAITAALYWPVTRGEFINYDDPEYVSANATVQAGLSGANVEWAFTTGGASNWHPLTWLSLMLDADLFGTKPAGFHFTNLALHSLNAVLLFALLLRLTGALWRSALVAALFAWHPVQVESVAWVSERKNVLSLAFGLVALIFYIDYARGARRKGEPGAAGQNCSFFMLPSSFAYGLSLGCFACGLMSKQILVTWPLVMLLLDRWALGRWNRPAAGLIVKEKIPFFLLSAAASAAAVVAEKHGGSLAPLSEISLAGRLENTVVSYARYLGTLFWPLKLAIFYPHPGGWPLAAVLAAGMFLAALSAGLFWLRHRFPLLLFGWLWFLGTLAPVIGLVQIGLQSMADRHEYIPAIGIFIIAVWGAAAAARSQPRRAVLNTVFALIVVLCFILTRRQIGYWQNTEKLFRHALAVTRNNFVAHDKLGIALHPDHPREAIREYEAAISEQPNFPDPHEELGIAWFESGQTNRAAQEFKIALDLRPDNSQYHLNYGIFLNRTGQADAAIEQFQTALRLDPDYAHARQELAQMNSRHRPGGSTNQTMPAIPDSAKIEAATHDNLGNLLARKGENEEAIREFKAALRLDPSSAKAHDKLGIVLIKQGRTNDAIQEFHEAARLQPNFAKAHYNLGLVLSQAGRTEEAIAQFRQALQIQPNYTNAARDLNRALELNRRDNGGNSAPAKP